MKRLVILVSDTGTGTNLQAIIDAIYKKEIRGKIYAVISDSKNAQAVVRARKSNLKIAYCFNKKQLLALLKKYNPDYICLAGWKQFISEDVIDFYQDKILNLHPGLIPDQIEGSILNPDGTVGLWNRGKLTNVAIQNFIDKNATFAGSSIHFLTHEFDFGSVLGRCFEKINPSDTIDSLYIRLKKQENRLYVSVLKKLCMEKLKKEITVAVIDSGGRGAALVHAYAKSKRVKKIIAIPGNSLYGLYSDKKILTFPKINIIDVKKIVDICKKEQVDLVDVAQDDAVAAGLVNSLQDNRFYVIGPTKEAGQIEWDKAWSREFMKKHIIPTPSYNIFSSQVEAIEFVKKNKNKNFFVKASGLAAGKGAIPAETTEAAISAIHSMKSFGKAGETFVIEEWLDGEEFSFFVITDGNNYQVIGAAQDHKRLLDGDLGPNTGGMGCSFPAQVMNHSIKKQTEAIIKKTILGLKKERRPYTGILYLGAIVVKGKVFVIEFNARWGDPEAEVILPGIKNDMVVLAESVLFKSIKKTEIVLDGKSRVVITGSLRSTSQEKQRELYGVEKILNNKQVVFYPTRVTKKGRKYFVGSGRLFYIVGEGKDVVEARERTYAAMAKLYIKGNLLQYRTDIGWRDLERKYI